MARGDRTTRIRSGCMRTAAHLSSTLFSNLHFLSPSFGGCPWRCSTRFCTSFCHFYAHLTTSNVGFKFLIHLVYWAAHFIDFIDLEQHPLMEFSYLYITAPFYIPLKLWNLSFALDLRLRIHKLGFLIFWCSVSDLKCLIVPFWCLANLITLIPWRNWNQTMRLLVVYGVPIEIAFVSGCVRW